MSYAAMLAAHARSVVLVACALSLAGLVSAISLPVGLFPQVSFPRVVVDLDAGSRPADQTALLVTRVVEQAVRGVPGVRDVRSGTTRGTALVSIDFGWGRDMVSSTLLVDAAVQAVLPDLPAGTAYHVRRMDPTVYPIISYALTSPTVSPVALRDFAQFRIVPLLSAIPGLARVGVQGGAVAEMQVEADPHRLAAYGLSLADLGTAVSAGNVLQSVGQVHDRKRLFLVLADRSLRSAEDIGGVVVHAGSTGIVHVRDVATVRPGVVPNSIGVEEDGRPAVLFNVYEQPDGNAVQVAAGVRAELAGLKLPAGVRLANWYDQSELVTQSAASVRDAVLIGLVLAGLVLFAFLRSIRVTLIAIVVVPATLAVTVLLLALFGLSFNIMTLGGIAAAVGLLIDDVIVMVEHIARRAGGELAGEAGGSDAVLPAARAFMRPLTGSSLATLIVFLPLSFLSGVTGAFSRALSITMGSALLISYLMTALVVPVLARRFIDFSKWHDPGAVGGGWLARRHAGLLGALLERPWILALVLAPVLALGWVSYGRVQTGFMPNVDEGGFVMDYYTPPGTSVAETARVASQIDGILHGMPEVLTFSRRLGTLLGGDLGESYHGDYFVRLTPDHLRGTQAVMAAVLAAIQAKVPGVQIETAQLMEDLIGDLTAVPQPIEIKLFGDDAGALIATAKKVAAAIGRVEGVVEVKDGVMLAGDALDVRIDPDAAALEGATPDDVSQAVSTAVQGVVATRMPQGTKSIGVRVHLPGSLNLRAPGLLSLPIRASDGHIFALQRVASIVQVSGQPEISRDNLQQMVAVTGRIEGRGLGAAVADVTRVLNMPGLLPGTVRYALGGLYRQQQIAFAGLARVFAAALIAEFVLLLVLYERFWLPVIIIACALLSTTAVFTALWLTGIELNITALMGMTMIIGIGTEMAIFYVSEYTELLHTMPPRTALYHASRNRLRPITMTTLAAILTLLPLALAIGQGSGIQQPLAVAVIAGLLLQYPLVLLVMPVLIRLTEARTDCPPAAQ